MGISRLLKALAPKVLNYAGTYLGRAVRVAETRLMGFEGM